MSGQFIVGSQLHPQLTTKAIRLRCVRSYVVTENRGEKHIRSQEIVFHDQEGMFIHVHIPKDVVAKYNNIFKEGQVYGIRNFLCITNFFKYKTSTLRYMIKFKHDSIVKEYKRDNFPKRLFRIKSFPSILSKEEVDEKVLFDVIGRMVEIYSPMDKVIAGKQTRLIDFVLEDTSQNQIKCTVWDDHVDQVTPYFNATVSDPVVVIIQLCRAKFMDSGEVRICSSFDATQLFFSHSCKEFVQFKNSFRSDHTPLRSIDSTSRLAVGFPISGVCSTNILVTSIEDIYKNKQLGDYWVAGSIVGVESILDWYYMSCKKNSCKRKLTERGGLMYCGGCKNSWHEGIVRYKVIVRVADNTGDASMLIWDRECANLVGMSAGELKAKYPEGNIIPRELQRLRGMSMLFQILMKKDQVESYYAAFTVLRICRDEAVLTQHCSTLLDCSQGEQMAGDVGDCLALDGKSEEWFDSDGDEVCGLEAISKDFGKGKCVVVGDNDEDSEVEGGVVRLKRCLLKDFDRAGGCSKKLKEPIKQEKQ